MDVALYENFSHKFAEHTFGKKHIFDHMVSVLKCDTKGIRKLNSQSGLSYFFQINCPVLRNFLRRDLNDTITGLHHGFDVSLSAVGGESGPVGNFF